MWFQELLVSQNQQLADGMSSNSFPLWWIASVIASTSLFRWGLTKILEVSFGISRVRVAQQLNKESSTLQSFYWYHLSIVVCLLSRQLEWNAFDMTIWIVCYVFVGMVIQDIQVVRIEREQMLRDLSFSRKLVLLLESSHAYSLIILIVTVSIWSWVQFSFLNIPFKIIQTLCAPLIMLTVDSFFTYLLTATSSFQLLLFFNQNVSEVSSYYRLDLIRSVVTSCVRFWHFERLFNLYIGELFRQLSLFTSFWGLSLLKAAYTAYWGLVNSIIKLKNYNKLLRKMTQLFTVGPSLPDQMCVICQEELINSRRVLRCGHLFHYKCIFQWIQTKEECPICRTPFALP